ncbi:hypothetical protein Dpo_1c01600 [Desulfotignum phosphitoxidans DSM 13687]|uniref:Uncharacterized protein n=1 Tax=Desulfotignum phosphitoxidans DSM 13687 TaxID=1286635 RepID=S0G5A5_9BACT|nr:hypothetical protein Dpo_1c01600 [Desulfotignum phosphitoxidans DSM 13687]
MASDHGLYIQMFSIHGLVRHQNMKLGYDADAYITARTIQFFAPGFPSSIMWDCWPKKTASTRWHPGRWNLRCKPEIGPLKGLHHRLAQRGLTDPAGFRPGSFHIF